MRSELVVYQHGRIKKGRLLLLPSEESISTYTVDGAVGDDWPGDHGQWRELDLELPSDPPS